MVKYSSLDKVFSAVADPTRRAIVDRLQKRSRSVSELAEPFHMSLPAIMKHVRILEASGFIVRKKTGRTVHCTLNPKPLREVQDWLSYHEKFWNTQLDNLGRYLMKEKIKTKTHKKNGK